MNGIKAQRQTTSITVKYLRSLTIDELRELRSKYLSESIKSGRQGSKALELGFIRLASKVNKVIKEKQQK